MSLWRDLLTPSPRDEGPADFAAYALGHMVIGAAALEYLGPWAWAFAAAYLVVKEGRDIMTGGGWADSLADAAFVAAGILTQDPLGWLFLAATTAQAREWIR